jgi:hypothetical protein
MARSESVASLAARRDVPSPRRLCHERGKAGPEELPPDSGGRGQPLPIVVVAEGLPVGEGGKLALRLYP